MSLDGLIQELKYNPDLEPSSKTILSFVDGPEFFDGFLRSKKLYKFKSILYKSEGNLLGVIDKYKDIFRGYLKLKYRTLDDIIPNRALANALGLPNHNSKTIAKACVERGFISPEIPNDHPIGKGSNRSWYVNVEVVGDKQTEKNLERYVQYTHQTLDDFSQAKTLASALGLPDANAITIAKACVERGFISPEIPNNYPIGRIGRISLYVNPKVVGKYQLRNNLEKYVKYTYETLDDINRNAALARVLNIQNDTKYIAKACVERGFISPEIPNNHPIGKGGRGSFYVNPEVVVGEQVEKNLERYVRYTYITLDDIKINEALVKALGLSNNKIKTLAKACVERGFISPEIPDNHPIGKGGDSSWYVDPEVVGEEQADKNLKKYVKYTYETLDDIIQDRALANALGLPDRNKVSIAKVCIDRGFISKEIPNKHPISKGKWHSWYVTSEVVGKEQVEKNLEKYVYYTYRTLDDVDVNWALTSLLGLPDINTKTLAKACVERGFINSEIPDNHPIGKEGDSSWYVDPEVVGEEQADKNLKKYVQSTYRTLSDVIRNDAALCTALGIKRSVPALRSKIAELGWLDSNGFRSYAKCVLPEQFQRKRTYKSKTNAQKLIKKGIGVRTRSLFPNTTLFIKGGAVENIFGFSLSYAFLDELIIPQYCLDVREDYFGMRVDFKVGNHVYEVKWGNAAKNIEETYAKHQELLTINRNKNLHYHLVRFDDQANVAVPYEVFGSLLGEKITDPGIRDKFVMLTVALMESADKYDNVKEIQFLTHFRDFIYNKVDEANRIFGAERQEYICNVLNEMCELLDESKGTLGEYMTQDTNRHFSPREAFFEYEGELYRGFIEIPQLEQEDSERYQTLYYFGDVEFISELDRNIAVIIELSDYDIRVEDCLKDPTQLQSEHVFQIPRGPIISTSKLPNAIIVNSLEHLKHLLPISDKDYNFGLEYIEVNGLRC